MVIIIPHFHSPAYNKFPDSISPTWPLHARGDTDFLIKTCGEPSQPSCSKEPIDPRVSRRPVHADRAARRGNPSLAITACIMLIRWGELYCKPFCNIKPLSHAKIYPGKLRRRTKLANQNVTTHLYYYRSNRATAKNDLGCEDMHFNRLDIFSPIDGIRPHSASSAENPRPIVRAVLGSLGSVPEYVRAEVSPDSRGA